MFIKKFDVQFQDCYMKGYSYDGHIYDVVASIIKSDLAVSSVTVIEDVDRDMKVYSGNYSYSEFMERDELYNAADNLIFFLDQKNASIKIEGKDNYVILTTRDPALEIYDLLPQVP